MNGFIEQNQKTLEMKDLTEEDRQKLESQDSRGNLSEFKAAKLENESRKNWDLFYKRNQTNFFKDRNWTTREFEDLLPKQEDTEDGRRKRILEVGCGVGNLIFPLLEDNPSFFYACDFSQRAVDLVKANAKYDPARIMAFQCDITDGQQLAEHIPPASLDVITMIFVLSAIHPEKFPRVVENLASLLRPGGVLLFRDYGRFDMAQIRFKAGSKIGDNFYVRQDGTRSYFFTTEEIQRLFEGSGRFTVDTNVYVSRRTINKRENLDVARTFLQAKFVVKTE